MGQIVGVVDEQVLQASPPRRQTVLECRNGSGEYLSRVKSTRSRAGNDALILVAELKSGQPICATSPQRRRAMPGLLSG